MANASSRVTVKGNKLVASSSALESLSKVKESLKRNANLPAPLDTSSSEKDPVSASNLGSSPSTALISTPSNATGRKGVMNALELRMYTLMERMLTLRTQRAIQNVEKKMSGRAVRTAPIIPSPSVAASTGATADPVATLRMRRRKKDLLTLRSRLLALQKTKQKHRLLVSIQERRRLKKVQREKDVEFFALMKKHTSVGHFKVIAHLFIACVAMSFGGFSPEWQSMLLSAMLLHGSSLDRDGEEATAYVSMGRGSNMSGSRSLSLANASRSNGMVQFRASRFKQDFPISVFSPTVSPLIDPHTPLCRGDLLNGKCTRGDKCRFQHFSQIVCSPEDVLRDLQSYVEDMSGEASSTFHASRRRSHKGHRGQALSISASTHSPSSSGTNRTAVIEQVTVVLDQVQKQYKDSPMVVALSHSETRRAYRGKVDAVLDQKNNGEQRLKVAREKEQKMEVEDDESSNVNLMEIEEVEVKGAETGSSNEGDDVKELFIDASGSAVPSFSSTSSPASMQQDDRDHDPVRDVTDFVSLLPDTVDAPQQSTEDTDGESDYSDTDEESGPESLDTVASSSFDDEMKTSLSEKVFSKAEFETQVANDPSNVDMWIRYAQSYAHRTPVEVVEEDGSKRWSWYGEPVDESALERMVVILERAVKQNLHSETLWLVYLRYCSLMKAEEQDMRDMLWNASLLLPVSKAVRTALVHSYDSYDERVWMCRILLAQAASLSGRADEAEGKVNQYENLSHELLSECTLHLVLLLIRTHVDAGFSSEAVRCLSSILSGEYNVLTSCPEDMLSDYAPSSPKGWTRVWSRTVLSTCTPHDILELWLRYVHLDVDVRIGQSLTIYGLSQQEAQTEWAKANPQMKKNNSLKELLLSTAWDIDTPELPSCSLFAYVLVILSFFFMSCWSISLLSVCCVGVNL